MNTSSQPEGTGLPESAKDNPSFSLAESGKAHFLFLGFCLLLLSATTWRKTASITIDFGTQLYVPWRILEGQNLYQDIAWKHGPFSQYFNALLFRIFGVSLTTLLVVNTLITAALTGLIYRIVHFLSDRLTALTAASVFLFLFAFSDFTSMGNWNYITPYTHESTHATFLAVGLVASLLEHQRRNDRRWLVPAGFALGVIALTKLEFQIAAVVVVTVWFLPGIITRKDGRSRRILDAAMVAAIAFGVIGMMFAILAFRLTPGLAFQYLRESWTSTFRAKPLQDYFYRNLMGLDNPGPNLRFYGRWLLILLGTTVTLLGLEVFGKRITRERTLIKLVLVLIPVVLGWFFKFPFDGICSCLSLLCLGAMIVGFRRSYKQADDPEQHVKGLLLCAWGALGFFFLLKIFFLIRIYLYGFIHSFPAMMLAVFIPIGLLPIYLRQKGYGGDFARTFFLAVAVIACISSFNHSNNFFQLRNYQVGPGSDSLVTFPPEVDSQGEYMNAAANILAERLKPGDTVAVIPEGILLNYWLRTPTSSPFLLFCPFDLTTYGGEAATVERMKQTPPTFIVLVHRPTPELGAPFFGTTPAYGQVFMKWIDEDYRRTDLIGPEPFKSEKFGIAIYEPRSKSRK